MGSPDDGGGRGGRATRRPRVAPPADAADPGTACGREREPGEGAAGGGTAVRTRGANDAGGEKRHTREELRRRDPEAAAALAGRGRCSRVPAGPGGVAIVACSAAGGGSGGTGAAAATAAGATTRPPSLPPPLRFLSFEEGESPQEVRSRVSAALASIAASFLEGGGEGGRGGDESGSASAAAANAAAIAVVSHGGAIAAAAAELFPGVPVPSRSANGSITEIVVSRKRRRRSRGRRRRSSRGGEESGESSGEEEEEEQQRQQGAPSFRDFDWRLLVWGDASHVPGARLGGGGAGAG